MGSTLKKGLTKPVTEVNKVFKRPKVTVPEASAAEKALSRRQSAALDKEIEEENRRKKGLLASNLGVASLISQPGGGAPLSLLSGVRFAGASRAGTTTHNNAPTSSVSTGGGSTSLIGTRRGYSGGGTNVGGRQYIK